MNRISRQSSPVQIMIYKKKLANLEYFNSLGSVITDDARCTGDIKCAIAMAKAAFNRRWLFSQANWN
jgi:hypothetical protein